MTIDSVDRSGPRLATDLVQRILVIARRALRVRDATLVGIGNGVSPTRVEQAVLTAAVAPFDETIATLVVQDDEARQWSDDDVALLRDVASALEDAIRLDDDRKHLRSTFDHVPGLAFEWRKTGPAQTRCIALTRGEMMPAPLRDVLAQILQEGVSAAIHRDDQDALSAAWIASIEEERDLDVTFRVADPVSAPRRVHIRAAARRDGAGVVFWSGLCSDVTALVATRDPVSPMVSSAAAPSEDDGAREETNESGMPRILLADDLDLNRKLICDMLSLDGYVVDSVADGAAAVEAVKAKTYDLVLMDMIMPGMDGIDATRAIRALPAPICDVPIVALTAHSFREQLEDCLHAGMNATLTKPMSFEALSSAVSIWARNRHQAA